ncbi:hypothetical protein IJH66_00230 [Candidatus Saccharibacteria bacterium]|nr:hypothetical protein [Candidatus Saccharibacteria bacterium]MBQ6605404.1 hypothetical protein [Candidatus Saccharibacteria bacterium]
MKNLTKTISQVFTCAATATTLIAGKAMALSLREGIEAAKTDEMPAELLGSNGVFTGITNTILYVVGVISVIMLIFGGIKYAISAGDSKKVTDAKNTILYAIIGLIITILSYSIVNFVLNVVGA